LACYSVCTGEAIDLLCAEAKMYNYNRDVAQAEQERMERMMTAAQRQVPYHMRRDGFTQATGWLAKNFSRPLIALLSTNSARASRRLSVYYRRASTRALGLILNTAEGLVDMVPGRA
jgi:hypothetical protein